MALWEKRMRLFQYGKKRKNKLKNYWQQDWRDIAVGKALALNMTNMDSILSTPYGS